MLQDGITKHPTPMSLVHDVFSDALGHTNALMEQWNVDAHAKIQQLLGQRERECNQRIAQMEYKHVEEMSKMREELARWKGRGEAVVVVPEISVSLREREGEGGEETSQVLKHRV